MKKVINITTKVRCIVKHKSDGIYIHFESKWLIFWQRLFLVGVRQTLIQVDDFWTPPGPPSHLFNPIRTSLWSNMTGHWDTETWKPGTLDLENRIKELCDNCLKVLQSKEEQAHLYQSLAK